MQRVSLLVLGLFLCVVSAEAVQVAPDHEAVQVRYVGRFTDDYRFGWTGCMVETCFSGSALSADLDVVEGPFAGLTVVVDGKARFLKVLKGRKIYELAAELVSVIQSATRWK